MQRRLAEILATLEWTRPPLPASTRRRLREAAEAIQTGLDRLLADASLKTSQRLALLHGDIAPGNLLWRPDPILIDWEYARLGDPADEIGYLFDQNLLPDDHRAPFWTGYRRVFRGDATDFARLVSRTRWWEPATLLGSTLWWVQRWIRRSEADARGETDVETSRAADYYYDRITERVNRLTERLAA